MKTKKSFSIIELMTVILIILLLISLLIPTFANVKMNARTALCKGQLRQISVLFNSYQSDNSGHLPNDISYGYYGPWWLGSPRYPGDIPPGVGNGELYKFWNGHLLPYIDTGLKSYNRYARVRGDGEVYTYHTLKPTPANQLSTGWAVLRDTFNNGGFGDLKVFICPEIHASTIDLEYFVSSSGKYRIPRITQLSENWNVTMDWDYLGGGTPTTFVANNIFFGWGDGPSYRMDQISELSQKALILEGGRGRRDGAGSHPYYFVNSSWYTGMTDGSDLSVSGSFNLPNSRQRLSYVHDNKGEFWVKTNMLGYYQGLWDSNKCADIVLKFNNQFAGLAYMAKQDYTNPYTASYSIISYIYPGDNGEYFDSFFKSQGRPVPIGPFSYIGDKDCNYLSGNMNVLFGDSSVMTKDQAWLCNNRLKIGLPSKE